MERTKVSTIREAAMATQMNMHGVNTVRDVKCRQVKLTGSYSVSFTVEGRDGSTELTMFVRPDRLADVSSGLVTLCDAIRANDSAAHGMIDQK
jgi:hypothetical protein